MLYGTVCHRPLYELSFRKARVSLHPSATAAMTASLWTWISQEDPSAQKHQGWVHPFTVMMIHYAIASIVAFGVHDLLVTADAYAMTDDKNILAREMVALGVAVYAVWLLLWRLYHATKDLRPGILYEYTWLCNVTLLFGAVAMVVDRPIVATAHCVAVGIDQLMWYVDLTGWAMR